MKKTIVFLTAAIILAGCTTIHKDLTKDPRFKDVITKTYQTNDDFVVTQPQDSKKLMLEKFDQQGVPSRTEIKKIFPYRYESNTIHGVLFKNTTFKVIKVEYVNNFESSYTDYIAQILAGDPLKGKMISVSLLTDGSEVPKFLEKYAVEVK